MSTTLCASDAMAAATAAMVAAAFVAGTAGAARRRRSGQQTHSWTNCDLMAFQFLNIRSNPVELSNPASY